MTRARAAVARTCARAGVQVRLATDLDHLDLVRWVCDAVWPAVSGSTHLQSNLLKAIVYSGGYASVALSDDAPLGAAVAIPGRHRGADGHWTQLLHSHMAGVVDHARDRGIGTALKQHQRLWAMEQDLDVISWTFDPLVRRNAIFNLRNLGVGVAHYEVNFYGAMDDALNHGDQTDRLLAWWRLSSPSAVMAAERPLASINVINHPMQTIEIPPDIVALRQEDPSAARTWRLRVRKQFHDAFARNWQVIGLDPLGNYVIAPATP